MYIYALTVGVINMEMRECTTPPAICMEGISKRLGSFCLQDINMVLPAGYIGGLIGENGAGKTTLLRLLLGLYEPDEGEVTVFGKSYKDCEREIKNDIGYVLAEELFCRDLTVSENAALYGKYYEHYEEKMFTAYCDRFSLEGDRKLKHLSKGERLKFQFAFALAHHPKLLLLDEPTANFDPEFREEFFHILTEFVSDGQGSVLLATHLTTDLDRLSDYVTFIHKGKELFSLDRETLADKYRLVCGETYKVKLLPQEKIVYQENNKYGTKALVRHGRFSHYDRELTVTEPTIEEVMYGIIKGGGHA